MTVETDTSTVERRHVRVTLRPGESLHYDGQGGAWRTLDARGAMLTAAQTVAPASAVAIPFLKVGTAAVAWFASAEPMRSGWAWGQSYLADGIAALEAPVGTGKLYLLGPEVAFRAGTHGTFKLLFNGLYLSTAKPAN